jgi:hypothetical protein
MPCATVRDVQNVKRLFALFEATFSEEAIADQLERFDGDIQRATNALAELCAPIASQTLATVNAPTQARAHALHSAL